MEEKNNVTFSYNYKETGEIIAQHCKEMIYDTDIDSRLKIMYHIILGEVERVNKNIEDDNLLKSAGESNKLTQTANIIFSVSQEVNPYDIPFKVIKNKYKE